MPIRAMLFDMSKTIAITGGGGFLGKAIVRQCLERGWNVRAVGRRPQPELSALAGVEFFTVDISRDSIALEKIFAGTNAVFHVAAKAGVWGSYKDFFTANVTGTQNVIDACRVADVKNLIYTSTPSVTFNECEIDGGDENLPYGTSKLSHYARTKAEAEQRVSAANGNALKTVSIRPHLIWGPGDPHLIPRVVEQAARGRLRIVGNGKNKVDLTHVENAAHAHLLAAEALFRGEEKIGGNAYFVSDGEPVVLWDWINHFLEAIGLPRLRGDRAVPLKTAYFAGTLLEAFWKIFAIVGEPPMTRFVASELAKNHWFKIDAIRRDLGYTPRVDHAQALSEFIEIYKGRS